jgi:hydrogenase maturation protease
LPAFASPSVSAVDRRQDVGATVVLGVGNLIQGDDGVGVHVAQALLERGCPAGVTVLDGGTAPLDALAHVGPVERLIIVDAANLGEPPGTIRVLTPEEIIPDEGDSVSLHDLDLLWALGAMRTTGEMPAETVVIGVQPESIDWSTELSPSIASRLEAVIEAVLDAIPARCVRA